MQKVIQTLANLFGYKRLHQLSGLCFNEQIYLEMVDQPKICDMWRKRVGSTRWIGEVGSWRNTGVCWELLASANFGQTTPRIRIVAPSVETCIGV